jgi:hypothetical protein
VKIARWSDTVVIPPVSPPHVSVQPGARVVVVHEGGGKQARLALAFVTALAADGALWLFLQWRRRKMPKAVEVPA